jgi:hypothetical protein
LLAFSLQALFICIAFVIRAFIERCSLKDGNMDHRFSRHRPGKLDEQADKTGREAIEEARMVLPGIQALFGFQLIAVFNERFKELTEDEQLIHFSATVLVTIAIALIMTPAAYHRLAEQTTISKFFARKCGICSGSGKKRLRSSLPVPLPPSDSQLTLFA